MRGGSGKAGKSTDDVGSAVAPELSSIAMALTDIAILDRFKSAAYVKCERGKGGQIGDLPTAYLKRAVPNIASARQAEPRHC